MVISYSSCAILGRRLAYYLDVGLEEYHSMLETK